LGFGAFKELQSQQNKQSKQDKQNDAKLKDLPLISFNYLGQFDSQEGIWQVIGEDSGESIGRKNEDENVININGLIVEGELSFSVASD
jgi:non-ribosomal peptide synthase protein (TIGR01720 family)